MGERPKADGGHGVCVHVGAELRVAVCGLITARWRLSLSLPPPLFSLPLSLALPLTLPLSLPRSLSLSLSPSLPHSPSLSLSISHSLPLSSLRRRQRTAPFCVFFLVKMVPQNGVVPDSAARKGCWILQSKSSNWISGSFHSHSIWDTPSVLGRHFDQSKKNTNRRSPLSQQQR